MVRGGEGGKFEVAGVVGGCSHAAINNATLLVIVRMPSHPQKISQNRRQIVEQSIMYTMGRVFDPVCLALLVKIPSTYDHTMATLTHMNARVKSNIYLASFTNEPNRLPYRLCIGGEAAPM